MWWRDSAMETHGKIFPTNGKVFISILEKAFKNTHFLSKLNEMSLRMFEKKIASDFISFTDWEYSQ